MIERVVGSIFYTSSVYEVANDNNNLYRNIVMDTTRMNQGCHNLILDNIKFKKGNEWKIEVWIKTTQMGSSYGFNHVWFMILEVNFWRNWKN